MAVKHQLTDEENSAVQTELIRLKDELGSWRAVGKAIGFPPSSDQQTISRAVHVRAGREVAEKLYAFLETDRDSFLSARGLSTVRVSIDEVAAALGEFDWSSVGIDDDGGQRVVDQIRSTLATVAKSDVRPRLPTPPRGTPAVRKSR